MIFPGRFAGKAMVVTGAAQGIGKMVALRAASEGARVLLVDRAPFVSEAAAEADGEAHGLVADLEDYAGAEAAMDKARTLLGGIDVLINNVGGAIRMRPYHAFEPGQIEAEIRRSLMPTLWCCHAALPVMLAQRGGTIVNISSTATCGIRRVPYSAAKGGINAMTASLAMEYGPLGIRVVAAAPGGTQAPSRRVPRNPDGDNDQEQGWMAEAVAQVTASTYMKRYGTLEEQAGPILFLASDEAAYITGSVLPVSGGDQG